MELCALWEERRSSQQVHAPAVSHVRAGCATVCVISRTFVCALGDAAKGMFKEGRSSTDLGLLGAWRYSQTCSAAPRDNLDLDLAGLGARAASLLLASASWFWFLLLISLLASASAWSLEPSEAASAAADALQTWRRREGGGRCTRVQCMCCQATLRELKSRQASPGSLSSRPPPAVAAMSIVVVCRN